ncbi:MAG TPA: hypothetical protein VNE39_12380 [Planctomycetota bacterium]|nr:hypothetical protein [Planctomycetota bacterium]
MIFGIRLDGLLILLALWFAAFCLWRWARRRMRDGRRAARPREPRKHPRGLRMAAGLLGLLILAAVGLTSVHEVRRCYARADIRREATVRVPTRPASLPEVRGPAYFAEIPDGRILFSVLFADCWEGVLRPLGLREYVIEWPEEKDRDFPDRFELLGYHIDARVHARGLSVGGVEPVATALVSFSFSSRGNMDVASGSSGGILHPGEISWPGQLGRAGALTNAPLSIAAGPRQGLFILSFVELAAKGDPLKAVPLGEWVEAHEADVLGALRRFEAEMPAWKAPPPLCRTGLMALAAYCGESCWLLLVAAALLAQAFARRWAAFVGMSLAVVLYVVVLDRALLGVHLAHMADAKAPLVSRVVACRQSAETFFFRDTAERALRRVADDAASPPPVRAAARHAIGLIAPPSTDALEKPG